MKVQDPKTLAGDFWGGLAAMLVALPSAIAFGVTIFAPMGGSYVAQGALAGILGTIALGIVAATFGGTKKLISAPCAPAAAILSALTIEQIGKQTPADQVVLMIAGVALLCGIFQALFGMIRLGTLIKYMPYPVVSGYLSGVGLIIILSQIPKFLGVPGGTGFWHALAGVGLWKWQSIAVGTVTVVVMLLAPKVTKAVPAAILALAAGVATYFACGFWDHSMYALAGNKLVIGALGGSGVGFLHSIGARWHAVGAMKLGQVVALVVPAATLAVLLCIDTLKTCVVLDTLTRSRHDSNRELIGQGLGNMAATVVGGMPGAGQMGATLVNMSSGGQTRLSGVMEGGLALLAFLVLGKFIAWVPIAGLAGILIVVGVRMFDRNSLHLLRSKSTILDFAVIVAVIIVAETVGLIPASAVGLGLAVMLFLREQIGGSVVRRKVYGNEMFSKQARLPEEMAVLEKRGERTVIFELQGSLFFGTADQLYTALEPELKNAIRHYIILDMRRVQSVDVTAAHMLENIEHILRERGGYLIFSHLPLNVPTGQDMENYFDQVGLKRAERRVMTFGHRDEALEWVEDDILQDALLEKVTEQPLDLHEIELLKGRKEETLNALSACMEARSYKAGEKIFSRGE
ncbi:MAG TPA: SulP family inorganic anion transporter, partial [Terriglobales bacterium]|nr:SulP family inorganic anion transporter [Terriglobales bacterium]